MTDGKTQVVWITGAGKGIGRALALAFARDGWDVAVSARTPEDLYSMMDEALPGRVHPYPLDVTDEVEVAKVVGAIERDHGPLDLAILNAGTHIPQSADDFDLKAARTLFETNVMGTLNALVPLMARMTGRRKGHIAVVASVAGYRGLPGAAGYGATKAALINLCEALYPDLARYRVKLTLINPGFVDTPLTRKNRFPMPFLITADKAAEAIMGGLRSGSFEIAFPWRFAMIMKLMRILPYSLYFRITKRMVSP